MKLLFLLIYSYMIVNEYRINLNDRNAKTAKVNLQIVNLSARLAMEIGKCYINTRYFSTFCGILFFSFLFLRGSLPSIKEDRPTAANVGCCTRSVRARMRTLLEMRAFSLGQ